MNIKINNIEYPLKYSEQLTVSEYISFHQNITEDSGTFEQLINYIAIVTGTSAKDVAEINISNNDINLISSYIGHVIPISDIEDTDSFYYGRKGRRLYRDSLNWRTLGARKMLEEKKIETQLEQCVYLLACYLSDNYDSDQVDGIYNDLLTYNFQSVFGFIVFFFKKFHDGQKPVKNSWLRRKLDAIINTLRLSKK